MQTGRLSVYQLAEYIPVSGNGVNEYVYQTCNLLAEEVDFGFIYFDLTNNDFCTEEIDHGFKKIHFPTFRLKGFIIPSRFKDWLKTIPSTSIFHLHSVFRPLNFTIARLLAARGFKIIFTPHDSYSTNSMKTMAIPKMVFLHLFDRHVMNKSTLVHAITSNGMKDLQKLTRNEVYLTTNFYRDNQYYHQDGGKIKNQICYIGRLDIHQKGLDFAVKAYSEFRKNNNATFFLIGNYTPDQLAAFNKLLDKNALENCRDITLTGLIPEDEKATILAQSYVYFQLSRFEGFGLSVVEALSFGKPVIISKDIPISNIIAEHGAGIVVSGPAEGAEALSQVFKLNPEEYQAFCHRARKCYENEFHPKVAKSRIFDMYAYAASR